jgi:hypothetical protein
MAYNEAVAFGVVGLYQSELRNVIQLSGLAFAIFVYTRNLENSRRNVATVASAVLATASVWIAINAERELDTNIRGLLRDQQGANRWKSFSLVVSGAVFVAIAADLFLPESSKK